MTALKYDIHAPLTIAAIQQAKTAHNVKTKRYFLLLLSLTIVSVISLAGAIVLGGIFISIWVISSVLLFLSLLVIGHLLVPMNFNEASDSDCARLLGACMSTPEGQTYRAAVLAQGRKFLELESEMIYAWANKHESRMACKKLYDVPG